MNVLVEKKHYWFRKLFQFQEGGISFNKKGKMNKIRSPVTRDQKKSLFTVKKKCGNPVTMFATEDKPFERSVQRKKVS